MASIKQWIIMAIKTELAPYEKWVGIAIRSEGSTSHEVLLVTQFLMELKLWIPFNYTGTTTSLEIIRYFHKEPERPMLASVGYICDSDQVHTRVA
jgi:hypothetical protein